MERVALLIPGVLYSPERPLLHFAGAVFERHGWSTREVQWPERPPEQDGQEFPAWFARSRAFVHAHLGRVLDAETAPAIALVGKSLGTFAAAQAADRTLPAIWLTPILRDSGLPADLSRSPAPFLLIGATADPVWDPEVARRLGCPYYEAPNADHSLEAPDDPVNSAALLHQATIAMDTFVRSL